MGATRKFASLKPALSLEVRFRAERAGALLFDRSTSAYYATNRTGLAILRHVNGRTSCGEILQRLCRCFPVAGKRTLERDLRRFLSTLGSANLIRFQ